MRKCVFSGLFKNIVSFTAETMSWADYRTKYSAPRTTIRKLAFTKEILENAAKDIMSGQSIRSVAKKLQVPESTLRKRLKAVSLFYFD